MPTSSTGAQEGIVNTTSSNFLTFSRSFLGGYDEQTTGSVFLGLFGGSPPGALFDRDDDIRAIFPEPLVIQAFNKLRKGELPWFLLVVGKLPEPLWVHAELARHLDMRV